MLLPGKVIVQPESEASKAAFLSVRHRQQREVRRAGAEARTGPPLGCATNGRCRSTAR
jgi:hypothetical protein